MYKNVGWTLGNTCPCNCEHCYSMQVREKGMDLTKDIIDTVVEQLVKLGVETVNFGGNEPIFTNGINVSNSLLPYIINKVTDHDMKVGITSSGISIISMEKYFKEEFKKINDIDISIDSPFEEEHDKNRRKNVFCFALEALEICKKNNIECSIVMCAMNWNFTENRIKRLVQLSKKYNANIRINMLKPTEKKHLKLMPSISQINNGYELLMELCDTVDMSDPTLAAKYDNAIISGCSCGVSSLRINSITRDGNISVSPCVYMHHYQVGNLLTDDILDIVRSKEFNAFRERKENFKNIKGCEHCYKLNICRGGCGASAYWYNYHKNNLKSMCEKDPYCAIDKACNIKPVFKKAKSLVHQNYLCTWIGKAKEYSQQH